MTERVMESDWYPEILEKAADILESETVGWCKGSYFLGSPALPPVSACAFGAIRMAIVDLRFGSNVRWTTKDFDQPPTWLMDIEFDVGSRLQTYMEREIPLPNNRGMNPYGWEGIHELNDLEGTTKEQVIEVMKATAKELRNNADH